MRRRTPKRAYTRYTVVHWTLFMCSIFCSSSRVYFDPWFQWRSFSQRIEKNVLIDRLNKSNPAYLACCLQPPVKNVSFKTVIVGK